MNIDNVIDAYITCLLWSETNEEGEPMDDYYDKTDIAPESLKEIRDDVEGFVALCDENGIDLLPITDEQIGHDFCLTRNGHGTGFWDRGLGDKGKHLTSAAKSFGSQTLYAGDDGRLYVC